MSSIQDLLGSNILNKKNQKIDVKSQLNGKTIGLYFSAHWCPPCRAFTPLLVDFYTKFHKDKNFEIIFISADSSEKLFKEYYKEMPWLCLDYNERDTADILNDKFNVNGIPKFVLIDGTSGDVLNEDARLKIQYEDKEGNEFPWKSTGIDKTKSKRRRNEEGCCLI